eukprot:6224315-Prymnesium_polylepis.3
MRAPDSSSARCCAKNSVASLPYLCVDAMASLADEATSINALAPSAPYASVECTSATLVSTIATTLKASDGITRIKYGYAVPSLKAGLVDEGETTGTRETAATCAAITEESEHAAPMIAWTPRPPNA